MQTAGTVYGFRKTNGEDEFPDWDHDTLVNMCKRFGYAMVAYDVSPVRVVSVR